MQKMHMHMHVHMHMHMHMHIHMDTAVCYGVQVFALDVVARFALLDGLATNGVLTPDARVLSVLASTQWLPVPQQLETLQVWGWVGYGRGVGVGCGCRLGAG